MKNFRMKLKLIIVEYSVPVRDGLLVFFEMPEQNLWTALLVIGIIIWAYKKPNKE